MRDHVLLMTGVFDVLLQQIKIKQINHPQPAAPGFVFVTWANSTRGCPDLHPPGRVLGSQLNHAVVRENYVRAITDEEIPINVYTRIPQCGDFLEKRSRIKNHAIADYA